MIFRIDDVCVNTDEEHLLSLVDVIHTFVPSAGIIAAVSPIVFDKTQIEPYHQRVHPPYLTAMSKLDPYYRGRECGVPERLLYNLRARASKDGWAFCTAGHGLLHVDHRLLDYQAQEMSIIASCSLAGAKTFVPPYNHWDARTEQICQREGFELVKFEDGWRHVSHSTFNGERRLFYFHPYDVSVDEFVAWFARTGVRA